MGLLYREIFCMNGKICYYLGIGEVLRDSWYRCCTVEQTIMFPLLITYSWSQAWLPSLLRSCTYCARNICRLFVGRGANIHITNKDGQTPVEVVLLFVFDKLTFIQGCYRPGKTQGKWKTKPSLDYSGFSRKARVIKCNSLLFTKRRGGGVMVPGVRSVDHGNWEWECARSSHIQRLR